MKTNRPSRKNVIDTCAAALATLQGPHAVKGKYADLTREENLAVAGLLGPEGQDHYQDVSLRFLDAVRLRCAAAVVASVEDTYYYLREDLAERAAS